MKNLISENILILFGADSQLKWGTSFQVAKALPRYQKNVKHKRGKGTVKSCVFVAANRDGQVRASFVANDSYSELAPKVNRYVDTTADLMSDQLPVYQKIPDVVLNSEELLLVGSSYQNLLFGDSSENNCLELEHDI